MKILFYGINFSPELTGIGKYSGEMARWLSEKSLDVSVVTAPPYYPEWAIHQNYQNTWCRTDVDDVVVYRCPLYVPKKVTALKRLFHLASFAISSGLRLISLLRIKPDVVFVVQPTLFCAPAALLYCKLTGAKAVMHIQDFEVDAMFGLGMAKEGLLKRLARKMESWLLQRFDVVSSISRNMLLNAQHKGVKQDRLLFFPNWANTELVSPTVCGDELREQWGYDSEDKVILYSGNLGKKQGLELILDVAQRLKAYSAIKFLIVGSGAHTDILKTEVETRGLTNIAFKPLQAWELVPQMLKMADVHMVIQKRGAADAVLPSKLTNILSCGGHAIVTAEPHTEMGWIAEHYPGIYACVEPECPVIFSDALLGLLKKDLSKSNQIARDYAVEFLSKDKVLSRFKRDMQHLVEND